MSAQAQQLTPAQQKRLLPRALTATGIFNAAVDRIVTNPQTKTVVHDFDEGIYAINGRYADNSVTIKEFYIQIPDDTETDKIIRLEDTEFTKVRVWYSVKSPTEHYAVRCISGELVIQALVSGIIKVSGRLVGQTETDPHGNPHELVLVFDLLS
ncbi:MULTISPECIES: hypothetical protein [unclassified Pseudomonas]|uniref:hypothetical protein n=1 Tax=unclassified Pseudomonas TaxID=196821 RepID=UPI0015A2AB9A|nr:MULTISPECIES: hypothetical protein [unclassified Pseudomonas]NWC94228.1 hypothetical protein [Pseudomonas sp. IPO3779]NWD18789.1 hypothetical protein [Pseudomonas sp. IPO3778]